MIGVQVFLMGFGAVLALIGVLVFFLLAWFKESTGQDHHNAIKILQAEFRFSNPALVIFAGGLLLMVVPFFFGGGLQESPSPTPTPVAATPVPFGIVAANPDSAQAAALTPVPPQVAITPTDTPAPPTLAPTPTDTPAPPTPPPALTPTLTPTPTIFAAPDPTGRWRNQNGFLEFRRLRGEEFAYSDFDSFGNQVGRGTASQEVDTLYISGEESGFDAFGNPYFLAYTGEMIIEGDILTGDLYDTFGNYLGSVSFIRDARSLGQ